MCPTGSVSTSASIHRAKSVRNVRGHGPKGGEAIDRAGSVTETRRWARHFGTSREAPATPGWYASSR